MPRLAVVYDSNLYRGLSSEAFALTRAGEANCSVLGYANYFVVFELLSHLADENDPSFRPSFAGLRRLWDHCKRYDGSRDELQFVADSEALVAHALFGRSVSSRNQEAHVHATIIGEICNTPDPASWSTNCKRGLAYFASHVSEVESRFISDLWNIVKHLNPEAKSWREVGQQVASRKELLERIKRGEGLKYIAAAIVTKAANEVRWPLSADDLTSKVADVEAYFPLPIMFYNRLVRRLIEHGPDMTKKHRANSIWDLQVAFSVGRGARLGGLPLWLISDDQELLAAAEESGTRWHVRTSGEYSALLGAGPCILQQELEAEPQLGM